jgi:serine/threonine protein kinase
VQLHAHQLQEDGAEVHIGLYLEFCSKGTATAYSNNLLQQAYDLDGSSSSRIPGDPAERIQAAQKKMAAEAGMRRQLLGELLRAQMSGVFTLLANFACGTAIKGHNRVLCHGHVNPDNLLVSGNGTFKLADYGMARTFSATHDSSKSAAWKRGTPR